ncbi:hypothetical protein B0O80DRAFT_464941 [Mortierella sp. GBAus27b]|nr:hypothetical protein B0O80DRAFT_464941 [Mortierella sp. GBAus27b]
MAGAPRWLAILPSPTITRVMALSTLKDRCFHQPWISNNSAHKRPIVPQRSLLQPKIYMTVSCAVLTASLSYNKQVHQLFLKQAWIRRPH